MISALVLTLAMSGQPNVATSTVAIPLAQKYRRCANALTECSLKLEEHDDVLTDAIEDLTQRPTVVEVTPDWVPYAILGSGVAGAIVSALLTIKIVKASQR